MLSISHRTIGSVVISVLIWLLLVGAVTVGAQAAATPIALGENKTGSIAADGSPVLYSIEVGAPQSVVILVLAVTPGFMPTFRVLDPGGVVVLDTANPGTQNIAQGTPNLSSSGTYTIEVLSANSAAGQFLISTQAGAPLLPPTALTPGTAVSGSVNAQVTRQAYSFSASASDILLLTVTMTDSATGAVIALHDADSDETLSLTSARLGGIRYLIPVGQANYRLEVTHSGSSSAEAFSVCVAVESGSITCPDGNASAAVAEVAAAPTVIAAVPSPTPAFAPIAINPSDACQVTPARNNSVNVRGGAGTNFNIVGQIAATGTSLVVGRLADNSWFQVNANGGLGWVSAGVVILGGNCGGVAVVVLPTAIPPTNVPPVNPPSNPTNPTDKPPTEAPQEAQPETPKLNPNAQPDYGKTILVGADYSVYVQSHIDSAGGTIDASYLGGGCAGLVGVQPTTGIYIANPALPGLLRFYFVHDDATDAVMVILGPDGRFHCGDDSYGTVNPTIDFNGPVNGFPRVSTPGVGYYFVWIGSHTTHASGTLYITNDDQYHP